MWNIEKYSACGETWVHNVNPVTHEREFVARFKYKNAAKSATHFVKFLKANFTPAEYFTAMQADKKAPLEILKEKGYVSFNAILARKILASI